MEDMKQMLARALLGSGMAGQAADTQKLYPMYQQAAQEAASQGQQIPPFEEWAAQFMGQQQSMAQMPMVNQ